MSLSTSMPTRLVRRQAVCPGTRSDQLVGHVVSALISSAGVRLHPLSVSHNIGISSRDVCEGRCRLFWENDSNRSVSHHRIPFAFLDVREVAEGITLHGWMNATLYISLSYYFGYLNARHRSKIVMRVRGWRPTTLFAALHATVR